MCIISVHQHTRDQTNFVFLYDHLRLETLHWCILEESQSLDERGNEREAKKKYHTNVTIVYIYLRKNIYEATWSEVKKRIWNIRQRENSYICRRRWTKNFCWFRFNIEAHSVKNVGESGHISEFILRKKKVILLFLVNIF